MKVNCKYSGIEFDVPNFANMRIDGIHPLFYASTRHLLSRTTDWAAGRLQEQERRILFLAFLNTTDLVEFRVAAQPADNIVQLNMESLIRFVGWQNAISNPAIAFPRFVVSHDTRTLDNFKHWMQAWYDAKKDFEDGYKSYSQGTKLRNREIALERLIKNAQKETTDYSKLLGMWAMDAGNVATNLRECWMELFQLKGLQIYNARSADLDELVEHMEDALEHGSIYANATLRHCRLLRAKNKAGLNFGLGIPDEELEKLDLQSLEASPYVIVEDEVLTYNTKLGAAGAPTEEPKVTDYPTRLAYLRARSAWTLASKARQYADDALNNEAIVAQQEDSDAIAAEEEAGIENDPEQQEFVISGDSDNATD